MLLRRGRSEPIAPVEKALRFLEAEGRDPLAPVSGRRGSLGTPEQVRAGIEDLAREYGAEEVLAVNILHDHDARRRSYELVARAFGLPAQATTAAAA